ncbi:O-antigen polymerase [Acinetobacter baumannii]
MVTIFFIISSLFFHYLVSRKTRDYLHPLGLGIFFWFFTAGISNISALYDANIQQNLSSQTNILIFLSGIFFIIPVFFSRQLNKEIFTKYKIFFGLKYRIFFNIFLFLSLVSFYLRFNDVLLNPPYFNVEDAFDVKSAVPPALSGVNLFDVFTPFLAVLCVFELFFSINLTKFRKLLLILFIIFSVIVSVLYKVSRGELIIFILAFIYLYCTSREIKFSLKPAILVTIFLSSFIYLGVSRIPSESRVSTQFGDGFLNIVFSQIYTYVAMNFQNLNTLVNSNHEFTYIWGGLKFILYPFFKSDYENNFVKLTDYNTEFFNAKTYIYYFFNDLGFIGALIYSLIIGAIIQYFYNLSTKNIKFFAFIACLLKAIFFMFFGNYFFGDNIIFLPYIFSIFLILMMRTVALNK